jgi:NitT/TauT family transport system permease protein
MIRQPISKYRIVSLGVLSIAVMCVLYSYLSYRQHQVNPNDKTIPSWRQLGKGVVKSTEVNPYSQERWVVVDALATAKRLFLGLFFGVAGALVLGMLMGCLAVFEAFLYPPLAMFAKIPPTAMLAVFFALAGTNTSMYVAMIAFGVLPTLAQSVYLAVRDVPDELQFKAYTLGASHIGVVWNVMFRQVLPKLLDAIRLQVGPAMVFLIAAEMVVGDVGFGYRIRIEFKKLNMDVVYPYLALLAAFGFGVDFGFRALQRILCPWYGRREGIGAI